MKKLLLVFGVLMGLVGLTVSSYALPANNSSLKTMYNRPLVSAVGNGNTAFVTGSTQGLTVQSCPGTSVTGTQTPTNTTLLACGSMPITAVMLSGGASGGTVTIYDASTTQNNQNFPGEVGPVEVVYEATVAANTQNYVDLSNAPINTVNGVTAMATSTSGVVVYSSTGIATNQ